MALDECRTSLTDPVLHCYQSWGHVLASVIPVIARDWEYQAEGDELAPPRSKSDTKWSKRDNFHCVPLILRTNYQQVGLAEGCRPACSTALVARPVHASVRLHYRIGTVPWYLEEKLGRPEPDWKLPILKEAIGIGAERCRSVRRLLSSGTTSADSYSRKIPATMSV